MGLDDLRTRLAVGLVEETRKGFELLGALARWRDGLGWSRCQRRSIAWPHDMQHHAQPQQSQQHQLVEYMVRYHGVPPHTGGERGLFYQVFSRLELSAS